MNKYVSKIAALMILCIATGLFSCDKGDEKFDENVLSISQKWVVTTRNSIYASFEFNKDGNYIVIENKTGTKSAGITGDVTGKRSFFQRRASQAGEVNLRAGSSGIHTGKYKMGI